MIRIGCGRMRRDRDLVSPVDNDFTIFLGAEEKRRDQQMCMCVVTEPNRYMNRTPYYGYT